MASEVRTQALRRASEILGGFLPLRSYLKVSTVALAVWMSGAVAPPNDVFLKVVDLIVERDLSDLKSKRGGS
jgi:hypothetical protein